MTRSPRVGFAHGLSIGLASTLLACTSVVRPPPARPMDPVSVILAFDDRHRGLILPRPGGGHVEYGFGDRAWYAEMRDAWYRVFPTVLWPTEGALGRRQVAGVDIAALRAELPWMRMEEILVERAAAETVLRRLDERFDAGAERRIHNATYGIDFVPDPDGYWCLFNCNDAMAGWLEELGCQVSWVPVRVDLKVVR